jgi:hypothetical protein
MRDGKVSISTRAGIAGIPRIRLPARESNHS